MPGTLAPSPWFTGFDDNGNPLSGGLLYTYVAGTVTPATTWSDAALSTPNANPIVLDSAGRATIYLSSASYKFTLKTAAAVLVRTQDNIQSVGGSATSGLGELFVFGGDANTPVTVTSYPAGAGFDKIHGGSAVFNVDSANLAVGTYILEAMGVVVGANTLTVALVNLSDGAPDTPIATATFTSTVGARAVSAAITFAGSGAAKNYGIKVKMSAGAGYAWGCKLVRTV